MGAASPRSKPGLCMLGRYFRGLDGGRSERFFVPSKAGFRALPRAGPVFALSLTGPGDTDSSVYTVGTGCQCFFRGVLCVVMV